MIDQRDAQRRALYARRGYRGLHIGDEIGRRLLVTVQLPSQDVSKAARLRSIRVEETRSVKMLRVGTAHRFQSL
jgi:hypothetical protein